MARLHMRHVFTLSNMRMIEGRNFMKSSIFCVFIKYIPIRTVSVLVRSQ